jgi:hypothetical protein
MEDNLSLDYMEVWYLDELKVAKNICQVEFVVFVSNIIYKLGYVQNLN